MGMGELGDGAGLALEALVQVGAVGEPGGEYFDGNRSEERRVGKECRL